MFNDKLKSSEFLVDFGESIMTSIDCVYVTRTVLPSTSASSIHVMKISEEFNKHFHGRFRVLVCKKLKSTKEICERYGVDDVCIEAVIKDNISVCFAYQFARSVVHYMNKYNIQNIITRDPITALLASLSGKHVVLDLHGDLRHLCGRFYHLFKIDLFVRSIRFVAISNRLKQYYIENYGMCYNQITVIHDGVTVENFMDLDERIISKEKCLTLGYFGKFTLGKGIDTIAYIAERCNECRFIMYGGSREDAEEETGIAFPENVIFGGYVDNSKVPAIMDAIDIMLLPNKKNQICNDEYIGEFTSPLKMFEYMASGRPIIASDIPVLREVLNESNAYLVDEENIEEWIFVIRSIMNNPKAANEKARQARIDVLDYSWKKRAETMAKLINI